MVRSQTFPDVSKAVEAMWIQDWAWDRAQGIPGQSSLCPHLPVCAQGPSCSHLSSGDQKVLALYASSDKTVYCWEQERNHLLHSKEKLGSLYTKLFYCASKDNQTCVLQETGGRGFSPQAVSSPNQASTIFSLFHSQSLPLLCIMDDIVRDSFLMYSTKEETVSCYA